MLKDYGLHVICYTGFTYEELMSHGNKYQMKLLKNIDILIDGPYIEQERDLRLLFKGSRNQRIIDVQNSLKYNTVILSDIEYDNMDIVSYGSPNKQLVDALVY